MSSAPSRSRPDALSVALDAATARIAEAVVALATANPVVAIDGQSGAGKTSLARRLVARWPHPGRVQSLALDSVYPGWDGLVAGVEYVRENVLIPHGRGIVGVWQRWDWEAGTRAEAYAVEPSLPLIVEGSGLLTAGTAPLADIRVWVDAPAPARRTRALDRDGAGYLPFWEMWAEQEDAHLAADDPASLATLTVALP